MFSENTQDVYFEENYFENGIQNDENNLPEEDGEKKERGKVILIYLKFPLIIPTLILTLFNS